MIAEALANLGDRVGEAALGNGQDAFVILEPVDAIA